MYRTIVVGVTNHDTALAATREAMELAHAIESRVHLVYAIEAGDDRAAEVARQHADGLMEMLVLASPTPVEVHVEADEPARAIVGVARRVDADLIVIGNQGLVRRGRFTAEPPASVLLDAPCSVLVVDTSAGA